MTKKADDSGKTAVLTLVRQLLKQDQPFTIGVSDVPRGLKALGAAQSAADAASDAAESDCKQWAYVPGVGLICIER
ncbi:hypothetical protein FHS79_002990 [Polymorphobacter multimanifer]|uniref:Uncharacterized protein n=1 Tax=Polymorphobacter multimanifer TaxID=1070431 RepID=A0A841L738_9SPHN|nr:hypothetical protein [Polymorphobacter multimanifer]MBB6228799.1 hypothetical protein [Polymorphobacter multimanifer]